MTFRYHQLNKSPTTIISTLAAPTMLKFGGPSWGSASLKMNVLNVKIRFAMPMMAGTSKEARPMVPM